MAAFAPQDPLEAHLVEELARLGWKRKRVERAQAALQEREVEKLELSHLRQLHALNRESLDSSAAEIAERGLKGGATGCDQEFTGKTPLLRGRLPVRRHAPASELPRGRAGTKSTEKKDV